ncbi:MAG: hypothetical protein WAV78_10590, partial [Xanthobacteraceae bacterium]
ANQLKRNYNLPFLQIKTNGKTDRVSGRQAVDVDPAIRKQGRHRLSTVAPRERPVFLTVREAGITEKGLIGFKLESLKL